MYKMKSREIWHKSREIWHKTFGYLAELNQGSQMWGQFGTKWDESGTKKGQTDKLAPNGPNVGRFNISFQYILARRAKMY